MYVIVFTILLSLAAAQFKGYWWQSWNPNAVPPSDTNIGIAFSGWIEPGSAIRDSNAVYSKLPGKKFISFGGGNEHGRWTGALLNSLNAAIDRGDFSGYQGFVYDIEEGDSGLAGAFESSFQKAKAKGIEVLVTISHSTPYGVSDGVTLMNSILTSRNIDYLSPQLYTTGYETVNDFATNGVSWQTWATSSIPIIPSIVTNCLYSSAESQFKTYGITTKGYVVWSNTASSCTPSSGPPPATSTKTTRCGKDWTDANSKCQSSCVDDSNCGGGKCFKDLDGAPCAGSPPPQNPPPQNPPPNNPPPSTVPSGTGSTTTRCGTDWAAADSSCGKDCKTDSDCSGMKCFTDLKDICKGNGGTVSSPKGKTSTRCGSSWGDADTTCGVDCINDDQCGGGHCYANLKMYPCNANAVGEISTMSVGNSEMDPRVMGLSVALVVVGVALVVVSVMLYKKVSNRKYQESV